MRGRKFVQVDVFSSKPTKGNGLAVVVEADGLTEAQMQDFAAWTNLAETTFLIPPGQVEADYRVRIFTPTREMPFAGHPTLGSCAAWLHAGGVPKSLNKVVQECSIGLVEIDLTGDALAFIAPATVVSSLSEEEITRICQALNIDQSCVIRSARLENGPIWQVLELPSAEAVLAIDSSLVRWPDYVGVSVLGAYDKGAECQYEIRNLSPSSGMSEDPITGSLNAAIAKWMQVEGRLQSNLTMGQGICLAREGRVLIRSMMDSSDRVLIGGHTQIVIDGTVYF